MRVDEENDFHGYSQAGMIEWLNAEWGSRRWHGLRRIRIIHGKGEVLHAALREWCDQKGIPWAAEAGNPGATIIRPAGRQAQTFSPAHKPLTHIKRHVTPSPESKPPPTPDPDDAELFEQAVSEIDQSGRRGLYRRKHAEE